MPSDRTPEHRAQLFRLLAQQHRASLSAGESTAAPKADAAALRALALRSWQTPDWARDAPDQP